MASPNSDARKSFSYKQCYCEENIYKLCEFLKSSPPSPPNESYVLILTNALEQIPIHSQRSSPNIEADEAVIWDYHVIHLQIQTNATSIEPLISDFDSILPFPSPLSTYIDSSFKPHLYHEVYAPIIRVINADDFLNSFSSDRSHMIVDREYSMPVPDWPRIRNGGVTMNLNNFIDVNDESVPGLVMTLDEFKFKFGLM